MSEPVLELRHLGKTFGNDVAVDDLSLEIRSGECLGLIGPNGAGKTTTLRICLGALSADAGEVLAFGKSVSQHLREIKQRIGVVSQFDSLDPDFTCAENLAVYGRYFGLSRSVIQARIPSLLDFAALQTKAGAKPSELSGGMRRRLSLARALVNDPDLLLLDEPTTGLDPQARHIMWDRLQQLMQLGKAILLTTHFMDEAERLCDRLVVVDHGRKIAEGTPRGLIQAHLESDVVEVYGPQAVEAAQACGPLAERVEVLGETAFFYVGRAGRLLDALEPYRQLKVLHRPANLEDLFLKLTGRQIRDQ